MPTAGLTEVLAALSLVTDRGSGFHPRRDCRHAWSRWPSRTRVGLTTRRGRTSFRACCCSRLAAVHRRRRTRGTSTTTWPSSGPCTRSIRRTLLRDDRLRPSFNPSVHGRSARRLPAREHQRGRHRQDHAHADTGERRKSHATIRALRAPTNPVACPVACRSGSAPRLLARWSSGGSLRNACTGLLSLGSVVGATVYVRATLSLVRFFSADAANLPLIRPTAPAKEGDA